MFKNTETLVSPVVLFHFALIWYPEMGLSLGNIKCGQSFRLYLSLFFQTEIYTESLRDPLYVLHRNITSAWRFTAQCPHVIINGNDSICSLGIYDGGMQLVWVLRIWTFLYLDSLLNFLPRADVSLSYLCINHNGVVFIRNCLWLKA